MSLEALGGPASIVVETDFGTTGMRGTNFYLSNGNPNVPGSIDTNIFTNTPILYDLCINIKPDDANYLDVYQYLYVPQLNTNMWVVGLQLAPALVAEKETVTFVPGAAIGLAESMGYGQFTPIVITVDQTLAIALSLMTQEQRNQAFIAQSNIMYEIYNNKPITSMIIPGNVSVNTLTNEVTVPVSFAAAELDQTLGWIPLIGQKTVSFVLGIAES